MPCSSILREVEADIATAIKMGQKREDVVVVLDTDEWTCFLCELRKIVGDFVPDTAKLEFTEYNGVRIMSEDEYFGVSDDETPTENELFHRMLGAISDYLEVAKNAA